MTADEADAHPSAPLLVILDHPIELLRDGLAAALAGNQHVSIVPLDECEVEPPACDVLVHESTGPSRSGIRALRTVVLWDDVGGDRRPEAGSPTVASVPWSAGLSALRDTVLDGVAAQAAAPVSCDGPVARLSPRESEVLVLVGQGHTTAEIARLLGIHAATVDNYKGRLFRKLGATTAAGAMTAAVRAGYLDPQQPAG